MAYSTQADLEARLGTQGLAAISDLDADGVADASVVEAAIEEADRLIDSYAHKRHAVPFSTTPATIRQLSARMAIRNLRRDRTMTLAQDLRDDEADRKWLEDLAAGRVTIAVEPAPPATELAVDKAGERESTRTASRERLKGYW